MHEERGGIAFRDVLTVTAKVLGSLWIAFLVICVGVAWLISSGSDPDGAACRATSPSNICFTHTEAMQLLGAIGLAGMAALTLAFGVGLGIIWVVMRIRTRRNTVQEQDSAPLE